MAVSICIFSSPTNVFFGQKFVCLFLSILISVHLLCITFSQKKCRFIWPFFETLHRKSTVNRLSRLDFFERRLNASIGRNFVCLFLVDSLSEHPLCITFMAKKSAGHFEPLFRNVSSKITVYRLSWLHFFDQLNLFFGQKFVCLFLSILYQSIHCALLSVKKSASDFQFFRKVASERYSQ